MGRDFPTAFMGFPFAFLSSLGFPFLYFHFFIFFIFIIFFLRFFSSFIFKSEFPDFPKVLNFRPSLIFFGFPDFSWIYSFK